MHNQTPYLPVIQNLGLSTHVHQLVRRKAKYPHHFTIVNNEVFISSQYSIALQAAKQFNEQIKQLQKGGADD